MSENFNLDVTSRIMGEDPSFNNAKVKVFGVGGAGGNTVNRMKQMEIDGVEYYAVNTDAMALDLSLADHKILIGEKTTRLLGAGMDPEKGKKAVEENLDEIKSAMAGADMVFVAAGMGGGTGTGAAPVVASIAREMGILTVAVVTKPFRWEGKAREKLALKGIENLRAAVDTIIVVENKKLLALIRETNKSAAIDESFKIVDEILGNAVKSICGIMFNHGLIHVDFADIRRVMSNGGSALMGTGIAQGESRGKVAADAALASPLLEDIDVHGATGVLVNVAHGENYSLLEHDEAMEYIYEKVGEEGDPNIIIGDITDPTLGEKVSITIIATGCGGSDKNEAQKSFFSSPITEEKVVVEPQKVVEAKPVVQQATARPTSWNVFDFNKIQDDGEVTAPVETVKAVSIPTTETQNTSAAASDFRSKSFNTTTKVEEEVFGKSETTEMAQVSDVDDYQHDQFVNYGAMPNGDSETLVSNIIDDDVNYDVPAFIRNQMNNY